jgi:hypothetical protein
MGELDEELKQSYLRTQKLYLENADEQTTKSQITQFANCWFMSKKESVAMWKLYSNCDSVAIKVKPENIINIVKSNAVKIIDTQNKYKLFYDKVSYLDLIPFDLFNRQKSKSPFSSMKKDTSYLHENEFRFGVAKNINGIFKESFSIPIPEIFTDESFGIVTFPNMENWKIENLRDLLRIYKLEDKLTESQLSLRTN